MWLPLDMLWATLTPQGERDMLTSAPEHCCPRVVSSAGRARRSHRRGHWFESSTTHRLVTRHVSHSPPRSRDVGWLFRFSRRDLAGQNGSLERKGQEVS